MGRYLFEDNIGYYFGSKDALDLLHAIALLFFFVEIKTKKTSKASTIETL
jgi:hypothetical protein